MQKYIKFEPLGFSLRPLFEEKINCLSGKPPIKKVKGTTNILTTYKVVELCIFLSIWIFSFLQIIT